jgi:hypothetical protein
MAAQGPNQSIYNNKTIDKIINDSIADELQLAFKIAFEDGQLEDMQRLLSVPFIINDLYFLSKMIPEATKNGQTEAIALLFAKVPCLQEDDVSLSRAFGLTCANGQLETMRYLLTKPALENDFLKLSGGFLLATENGNVEAMDFLLSLPKFINSQNFNRVINNALILAAGNGQLKAIERILTLVNESETNISYRGLNIDRALSSAAKGGHIEAMELILKVHHIVAEEANRLNIPGETTAAEVPRVVIRDYAAQDENRCLRQAIARRMDEQQLLSRTAMIFACYDSDHSNNDVIEMPYLEPCIQRHILSFMPGFDVVVRESHAEQRDILENCYDKTRDMLDSKKQGPKPT